MERTAGGRRHRAPRGRYLATTATFTILLMFAAAPARADVRDFLGRPLVDVRVEIGSVALADDSVLQLIETRIGDALSMQRVRETIDHLVCRLLLEKKKSNNYSNAVNYYPISS